MSQRKAKQRVPDLRKWEWQLARTRRLEEQVESLRGQTERQKDELVDLRADKKLLERLLLTALRGGKSLDD